jgi:uncharacterized protein (UPF0332 family)
VPRADIYISNLFPPRGPNTAIRAKVLTPLEAAGLSTALRADAGDLYYSAWVTFIDALRGVENGFYTWATVKLYYAVFYAFRASLAYNNECAFHVGRSAFAVTARPGESPVSCTDPGTHKVVLKMFAQKNPGHALISQQIDLVDAVDWLVEKREAANYRTARFSEPDCDPAFEQLISNGFRRTINAYLSESTFLYVFDPDHAVVAYPLCALQLIGTQLSAGGLTVLSEIEKTFLLAQARDKAGKLAGLIAEMKRIGFVN